MAEKVQNFFKDHFLSTEGSSAIFPDILHKDKIAKLLFKSNFLQRFGFPFEIVDSSISKLSLQLPSQIFSGNNFTATIEEVTITVKPCESQTINEERKPLSLPISLDIKNFEIIINSHNDTQIMSISAKNVKFNLSSDTSGNITMEDVFAILQNCELFHLSEISFSITQNKEIKANVSDISINISRVGIDVLESAQKYFNNEFKFDFTFGKLNLNISHSMSVTASNASVSMGNGYKIEIKLASINLSSLNFGITDLIITDKNISIGNIFSRVPHFSITKKGSHNFIDGKDKSLINCADFQIESTPELLFNAFTCLSKCVLIDIIKKFIHDQTDFSLSLHSLTFVIKTKSGVIRVQTPLRVNHQKGEDRITLDDFSIQIDGFPAILEKQHIDILKSQSGVSIYLMAINIFLIAPELQIFFEFIEFFTKFPIDFINSVPTVSFPELNVYLCVQLGAVKKPMFLSKISKFVISSENHKLKISPTFQAYFLNVATSKMDAIVEPVDIRVSGEVDKGNFYLKVEVGNIHTFVCLNAIKVFLSCFKEPRLSERPLQTVANETNEVIIIEGDNEQIELKPGKTVPLKSNVLKLIINGRRCEYSVSLIAHPMYIDKNLILSATADGPTKTIRFTPRCVVENKLWCEVTLHVKSFIKTNVLMKIGSENRVPLPALSFSDTSFIAVVGETPVSKGRVFKVETSAQLYQLANGDGEISVQLLYFTDSVTNTRILSIQPIFRVNNQTDLELNVFMTTKNSMSNRHLLPGQSDSCSIMNDSDGVDFAISYDQFASNKVNFKMMQPFEKNIVRVRNNTFFVTMEQTPEKTSFTIYAELHIINKTDFQITISTNESVAVEPKSEVFTYTSETISLVAFGGMVPLPWDTNGTVTVDNYTLYVRIENYNERHTVTLEDIIVVENELDFPIKLSIVYSEQEFPQHSRNCIRTPSEDGCYSLMIDEMFTVSKLYLRTVFATTIQAVNDEKRIIIDLTIKKEENTYIATFSPAGSRPRFAIVNSLSYPIYVQQCEEYTPLKVLPMSSSAYGFDKPFESMCVVATIQGRSQMIDFKQTQHNISLPFFIQGNHIKVNVTTVETNGMCTRYMQFSEGEVTLKRPTIALNLILPQITISTVVYNNIPFSSFIIKNVKLDISNSHVSYLANVIVESIEGVDHTGSVGTDVILKCGGDRPFIEATAQYNTFPLKRSSLVAFSVFFRRFQVFVSENFSFYIISLFKPLYQTVKPFIPKRDPIVCLINSEIGSINIELAMDRRDRVKHQVKALNCCPNLLVASCKSSSFDFERFCGPWSLLEEIAGQIVLRMLKSLVTINSEIITDLPASSIVNFQCNAHSEPFIQSMSLVDDTLPPCQFDRFSDRVVTQINLPIAPHVALVDRGLKSFDIRDAMNLAEMDIQSARPSLASSHFLGGAVRSDTKVEIQALKAAAAKPRRGRARIATQARGFIVSVFERSVILVADDGKETELSIDRLESAVRSGRCVTIADSKGKTNRIEFESEEDAEELANSVSSCIYENIKA